MAMAEALPVTPIYNVDGGKNDMFGEGGSWIFFLFFLLAYGGNGFGGFGGNAGAGANMISNDFMYSNLTNQLGRITDQNTFANNAIQQGICSSTYELSSKMADIGASMAQCCCETNRNIDAVRYEGAKNTCDIITAGNLNTRDLIANQTANTQAILDKLTQSEITSLRDKITAYEIQLSNQAQTANIVSMVRPYPVPSYPVCPPWENGNGNPKML